VLSDSLSPLNILLRKHLLYVLYVLLNLLVLNCEQSKLLLLEEGFKVREVSDAKIAMLYGSGERTLTANKVDCVEVDIREVNFQFSFFIDFRQD